MNMISRFSITIAAGALVTLAMNNTSVLAQQRYYVTDLGTLYEIEDIGSEAECVNSLGQVVGSAFSEPYECMPGWDCYFVHAVLFEDGVLTDLGTLDAENRGPSCAWSINDFGQIVGYSTADADGGSTQTEVAVLWDTDGALYNLGTLGGTESTADAINNAGQVVGAANLSNGERRAFLWQDDVMTELATLPDTIESWAADINESGLIAGYCEIDSWRPVLWDGDEITVLPGLDYSYGYVEAINDLGQAVGASLVDAGSGMAWNRAVLWEDGVATDLGSLNGTMSKARDINNLGQIVGQTDLLGDGGNAFIWEDGVMTDLNSLIPPDSGWHLETGKAINDDGVIVGTGTGPTGIRHGFILTPAGVGDLDADGDVDLADLAALLASYGADDGGDLDGDGDTDLADLAMLLALYGTTYL